MVFWLRDPVLRGIALADLKSSEENQGKIAKCGLELLPGRRKHDRMQNVTISRDAISFLARYDSISVTTTTTTTAAAAAAAAV